MLKQLQIGTLGLAIIPLAGIVGCTPVFAPVKEIPPELEYVMQNKTAFAQDPEEPLADVVGGEVRDDLSGLNGCWGAFNERPAEPLNSPGDAPSFVADALPASLTLSDYMVFVFDEANQQMHEMMYSRDVSGYGAVEVFGGPFIVTDNQVTMTVREFQLTNVVTGALMTPPHWDDGPGFDLAWLVTLDGDRLKLRATPDEGGELADSFVFHRFECPQQGG